jgi:hypothetical protein
VISLTSTFRDIARELDDARLEEETFSSLASLDDNIEQQDLILMAGNQIQIFLNSIQPEIVLDNDSVSDSVLFLGALDYSRERDNYEFNIRDVIENIAIRGNRHLEAIAERTADSVIELSQGVVSGDIIPVALNKDDLDDVIIFTETSSSHIRGLLLLSN